MGRLTTHVLDTARGRPGAGIAFDVFRLGATRERVASGVTDDDGRAAEPLLDEAAFAPGRYEIVFRIGDYFSAAGLPVSDPPFLDEVVLRFALAEDAHYHVPLLVSPWSYSTYRGS